MDTMKTLYTTWRMGAALALGLVMLWGASTAVASDYRSSGGKHYHGGSGNSAPKQTYSRSVHVGYSDGGSGVGWISHNSGQNFNTGYSGADGSINAPHRGNWQSKLDRQRQWDEEQYRRYMARNKDGSRGICGLPNAPAYCYRLQGPYPQRMEIVRY